MNIYKTICFSVCCILFIGCVSTKSTLKNVDNNLPSPTLTPSNTFLLTTTATDKRYGYHKDYPINVFFQNSNWDEVNQKRFLNALAGPNGEKIEYKRIGICCPFPSKNINTGGGFLDTYQITYDGLKIPIILYINKYEKGLLTVPIGFTVKKSEPNQ
jgi:hypothetical protein